MKTSIKIIGLTWFFGIIAEIILALTASTQTDMVNAAVAGVQASANMSNPGNVWLVNAFGLWPILMWFIIPGIVFVVTVVEVRAIKAGG